MSAVATFLFLFFLSPLGFFLSWVLAMTLVTVVLYIVDKLAAKGGRRRASEPLLMVCAITGGGIGAFMAMVLLPHKRNPDVAELVRARAASAIGHLTAALAIYGLTLVMELFITSGSAKALLLIPILMPLADLVGVNRQIAVSAYCFGDGFSNLVYPTNAALLITLSLTVVPYHKWVKWLLKLWFWIFLATLAFLAVAVAIHYGPF